MNRYKEVLAKKKREIIMKFYEIIVEKPHLCGAPRVAIWRLISRMPAPCVYLTVWQARRLIFRPPRTMTPTKRALCRYLTHEYHATKPDGYIAPFKVINKVLARPAPSFFAEPRFVYATIREHLAVSPKVRAYMQSRARAVRSEAAECGDSQAV